MENKAINQSSGKVKIVRTTSTFDCGGRCPIKLHVRRVGEKIRKH
jgi:anaerobic selenocysteine-containing dehydrogenase